MWGSTVLERLRIRARLLLLVMGMTVLTAVVFGLGLNGMERIQANLRTVYEDRTVPMVQLHATLGDLSLIEIHTQRLMFSLPEDARHGVVNEIDAWNRNIDERWRAYKATVLTTEETAIVAEVEQRLAAYRTTLAVKLARIKAGDIEGARSIARAEGHDGYEALSAALSQDVALQEQVAREEYESSVATFDATLWRNMASVVFGLAATLILAAMIVRSITRPIAGMIGVMTRLAEADTTVEVSGCDRPDEIGDMAKAVAVFKTNAIERARLEEVERGVRARREERQRKLEALTDGFDTAVVAVLNGVSAAAHTMNDMSENMSTIADETQRQTAAVSAATEQASANVSTIAAAGNQLSASIREIGAQVARASTISAHAVEEVEEANDKMGSLNRSAQRIGEVVELINTIAAQTNLLALNATIEAARAGEAGKGFAVVASEVKQLANQTARATGEIGGQIDAIQSETRGAADAIQRITGVISEINEMSAAIAAAIEEQGAAMQEVVLNTEQAAVGVREVAASIGDVVKAAVQTGAMASNVRSAAGLLTDESDKLRDSVEGFLSGVKAA